MEPRDWQALLQEASRLHAAGRAEDAIAAYQRLLAANPNLPDSWFNLGWLQRQTRQFEAALASYQRALDLNVVRPEEAHLNRAAIFSEYLRQPRETEAELVAALDRNPRFRPRRVKGSGRRRTRNDRRPVLTSVSSGGVIRSI